LRDGGVYKDKEETEGLKESLGGEPHRLLADEEIRRGSCHCTSYSSGYRHTYRRVRIKNIACLLVSVLEILSFVDFDRPRNYAKQVASVVNGETYP
jgi:hypothetical protein